MDVSFDFVNEGVPSKILKMIFQTSNLRKTILKISKDAPKELIFSRDATATYVAGHAAGHARGRLVFTT